LKHCAKCGKMTDSLIEVHPIDKIGRNLKIISICGNCREKWSEYYKNQNIDTGIGFYKGWSKAWNEFMSDCSTKEKVEFT
jgi:hypothetical protein